VRQNRIAMLTAMPMTDLEPLNAPARRVRSRWVQAWLMGALLLLTLGSLVMLVLYLDTFEAEEEEFKGRADALTLEQSTQFHFRRLEDDLMVLARRKGRVDGEPLLDQGGHLWREPGLVLAHGWMAATTAPDAPTLPARWRADRAAHRANAERLDSMGSIARGLRRSDYAGPMLQANGTVTHVVWLAVPLYERGEFVGNYVAALAMDNAAQALAPAWFDSQQRVRLQGDVAWPQSHLAALNLPGVDLFWEVSARTSKPATAPRIFFLMAVLFLGGMLASLVALRRDFVARQKIQAQLQAEIALRTAMENSVTIGLRAWDQQGKILYVNGAFCRMVGYSAAELVGQSAPLAYWPSEQTDELTTVHRSILAQGTQGDGIEVQFQHRSGALVDVLIHEAPLSDANGQRLGWMSSVMDISERKRAQRMADLQQEKLEASGRMVAVGEVASTLAHELNQPLGALSSFSNGLLNRLREHSIGLDEMAPVVERMAALAERAGGIIQRVNAFARRRELSRQRMDWRALLYRVLPSQVDFEAPDAPVWVDADELLLEHLLNNLVGNALDWAGRGTCAARVRVALSQDAQTALAVLRVSDTGPGVPVQDHAGIFNAFYSTKEGGMGMGLAICRSIAEAHHGRIEVGHDAQLGGACFTVLVPLANP
jgi:two-component system sensor histidine kinase DctS